MSAIFTARWCICAVGCTNRYGHAGKRFFLSQTTSAQERNGFLVRIGNNGRQAGILKSVATTSSFVNMLLFCVYLFVFPQQSQPEGHSIPIVYLQFLPHTIQIAKVPSGRYILAFKLFAKSSQQECSGTGK